MRNYLFLLMAALAMVLTGCGGKKLTPAEMNTVEYLGHLRGTFGGYWTGPDGREYPEAISRSMSNLGISATLDVPGMSSAQLDRIESKLQAFAKKYKATYERHPAAASLTWPSDRFLVIKTVQGARPDTYGVLHELAELLNQDEDLLVLVHGHDPMVKYAVERGLDAGRRYTYDFLVALFSAPKLDTKRFSSFGCADGEDSTLTVTLLPREFVLQYPI